MPADDHDAPVIALVRGAAAAAAAREPRRVRRCGAARESRLRARHPRGRVPRTRACRRGRAPRRGKWPLFSATNASVRVARTARPPFVSPESASSPEGTSSARTGRSSAIQLLDGRAKFPRDRTVGTGPEQGVDDDIGFIENARPAGLRAAAGCGEVAVRKRRIASQGLRVGHRDGRARRTRRPARASPRHSRRRRCCPGRTEPRSPGLQANGAAMLRRPRPPRAASACSREGLPPRSRDDPWRARMRPNRLRRAASPCA